MESLALRGLGYLAGNGNFDVIFGPSLAHSQCRHTPHAPCDMLYVAPALIGWGLGLAIRCYT